MKIKAFFLFVIGLAACTNQQLTQPVPVDSTQLDYFPLEIGKYRIYQTDSIVFDFALGGATAQDSSRTYVKEEVVDTIRDQEGRLVFLIDRLERSNLGIAWRYKSTNSAIRTDKQAIFSEGNWRFLKLIFPMDRRTDWDGNLWIDETREIEIAGERMRPFSNWNYAVDSIDIQSLVGSFVFDSTLLVTEADDANIIERRYSRVRYAKHIGLVWREQWILDSQYCNQFPPPADCASIPWNQKAEKGYILRQTILSFN